MTDQSSDCPWLPERPSEPVSAATPVAAIARASGPTHPQRGIPHPSALLEMQFTSEQPPLWWLGVHGGAGETTMASLVESWREAGHRWPTQLHGDAAVVLVARTHKSGLDAARAAIQQWASGLVPRTQLHGLVLIADAPNRLPRQLRDLSRLVEGGVPRSWHIPWNESWRVGEPVSLTSAGRTLTDLVTDLSSIIGPNPSHTPQER